MINENENNAANAAGATGAVNAESAGVENGNADAGNAGADPENGENQSADTSGDDSGENSSQGNQEEGDPTVGAGDKADGDESDGEKSDGDEPDDEKSDGGNAGITGGGGTIAGEPKDPASLASIMQLCVGMLTGRVDEEELRLLLDAIAAREKIRQLEEELRETEERLREEMKAAVAEAYTQGEINGRNARITETMEAAMPLPTLTGAPAPTVRRNPASIFDLAANAR